MTNVTRIFLFPIIWPLGTTAPAARRPWATLGLLALNLAALGLLFDKPAGLLDRLALTDPARLYQYLTYGFVHPNLASGLANMILLWTFAPALEGRVGPWRLLLLYLMASVAGGAASQLLEAPGHDLLAGASASIFGLVGATLVLFPRLAVRFFVGLNLVLTPLIARVLLIPIVTYILLYVAFELLLVQLDGVTTLALLLDRSHFSMTAHLGGLLTGAGLALTLLRRAPQPAEQAPPRAAPRQALPRQAMPLDAAVIFQVPPPALRYDPPGFMANPGQAWTGAGEPVEKSQTAPPDLTALFGNPEDSAVAGIVPTVHQKPPHRNTSREIDSPMDAVATDRTGGILLSQLFQGENTMKEEASEPEPLLIPGLGSLPSHTDEGASPEDHARPAMRAPYDIYTLKDSATPRAEEIVLNLETSEETGEQALALKDPTDWAALKAERFSVILAPGRPVNLSPIVDIMAHSLGLSPKGAYHALLHRHGILAENLALAEATRVAQEFAGAGHPVLMVAMTNRLQFGEGLDLLTIQEHDDHVELGTVPQAIHASWSQIVFLAAGQVALTAGTPSRTVLDLYLVKPRHHLRLWENTFVYTKEAPRFRPTVELIVGRAKKAIHTRSLDKWLHGEKHTLHPFSSMIEYEHYLRWHLMAHLAQTKLVAPD